MKTELRRYTGYRIRFKPEHEQPWRWGNLKNSVLPLIPYFEQALEEPFFVDDTLRGQKPLDLINYALRDGEIFACYADGQLVGICSFRDIRQERSAIYDAWAVPEFRGPEGKEKVFQLAEEVMRYAFEPWPNGLGLSKVKVDIAIANTAALTTAVALGFVQVGLSPCDAFHNGEVHDSVLLELLNPAMFGPAVEVIETHEFRRRGEQSAPGTTVCSTAGSAELCDTTGPERDSATGLEREASDLEGELPGGLHGAEQEGQAGGAGSGAADIAPGSRPAQPRGSSALRGKLLPAIHKPAAPVSESADE